MDIEEQYDKIYRYCYFELYDKLLAQDITQETFLRFYRQVLRLDFVVRSFFGQLLCRGRIYRYELSYASSRQAVFRGFEPQRNSAISAWKDLGLSKGEMDFWREREQQIKIPYVYQEYRGYDIMICSYQTVVFFVWMLIAICLSGMEGFQAAFQFIYTDNSDNITCGQAVMIAYGNRIIAAMITSVFFDFMASSTNDLYDHERNACCHWKTYLSTLSSLW